MIYSYSFLGVTYVFGFNENGTELLYSAIIH